jgi:hypothetical protein
MNKKKASGNQVSGPSAPARGMEGAGWMPSSEIPFPRGEGSHRAREPVICQPQASHSASVTLSPLSPMLLVVAMVTSLQDEILVSTRTGASWLVQ